MSNGNLPTWTLLNADFSTVGREWAYSDVCSPFTRLYYITAGEGHLLMRDKIVTLRPENMYIIPAYMLHTTRCDREMSHYYLHIHETTPHQDTPLYEEWTFPDELPATENDATIFKRLISKNPNRQLTINDPKRYDTHSIFLDTLKREEQRSPVDRLYNNSLISILMTRWLSIGQRNRPTTNDKIAHTVAYIHSHFNHESLNIDRLATEASLSRHHFSRLFKAETGMPVGDYIRHLRIRKAQVMLAHTRLAVKEIGEHVGYSDYNYFIRVFHKETGITPSRYRLTMA